MFLRNFSVSLGFFVCFEKIIKSNRSCVRLFEQKVAMNTAPQILQVGAVIDIKICYMSFPSISLVHHYVDFTINKTCKNLLNFTYC